MFPQGVFDHFLIAGFKDVKGQKCVRKKKRAGKRHDGHPVWQLHGRNVHILGPRSSLSCH